MTPDWLFFDCFNTLIDDFDASGREWGLDARGVHGLADAALER